MTIKSAAILLTLAIAPAACFGGASVEWKPEVPIRVVSVRVAEPAREVFFSKMRLFAEAQALAIRIAPVRPGNQHFVIQLWREDFKAIGVNPDDVSLFKISIFQNDERPPEPAVINELVRSLTSHMEAERGISVIE